ncbi:MAG: 1-deoxy-D-xylulose-5-phosphate reductoisomerase [Bacteroidales bacterium]|jgi:1-deoxy-D-xylulose-5-phosphate reductoisomerase|nr:1-deoxy-D-xylulose-5-phosphate reductoisomerase [Bacteroidales bacterium]
MEKKRVALLGSTGSMGTQALEVIQQHPDLFEVEVLAAYSNVELLIRQAQQFHPNTVVIVCESGYPRLKEALAHEDIKVFAGEKSLSDIVEMSTIDVVLSCIVGIAGLAPVYRAIEYQKPIALANKETLVVAGELMMGAAKENGVPILPVDSEHSAIFQCLAGEKFNPIEKLIITASGGPFRGKDAAFLSQVTKAQALKHPTWNMGAKITIDSATMMNKGLEVIEARWLFDVPCPQIEVVVHPQSIVHSLVQFRDGSIKAQLGLPDMKLPIQYALTYPLRQPSPFPRFSFLDYPQLTFEQPDFKTFKCMQLAFEACKEGGNRPCVMNAANEVAVAQFLQDKIAFTDIPKQIEKALSLVAYTKPTTISEYLEVDREVRHILS